jgi:hypothetical protein
MELFSSLMVSLIGMGFISYGKKQHRPPQLILGVVLTVFPYFVSGVWPLWLSATALVLLTWVLVRLGL